MSVDGDAGRQQSRRSRWLWDFVSLHGTPAERMSERVRQLAIEHLDLKSGERVLDLGCGTGSYFEPLRQAIGPDGEVVGVDFSLGMVRRAEERIKAQGWSNVRVMCADAAQVRLGCDEYDAAIATFSLSAIADMPAAVENVRAALRPGGRFFVCDLRLIPEGRAGLAIWVLGLVYRLIAGWSGRDVLYRLRATFQSVDLVLPLRPWPPVMLAVARKTDDTTAR